MCHCFKHACLTSAILYFGKMLCLCFAIFSKYVFAKTPDLTSVSSRILLSVQVHVFG